MKRLRILYTIDALAILFFLPFNPYLFPLVLPALVVAGVGIFRPAVVTPRRRGFDTVVFRGYVHGSAALAVAYVGAIAVDLTRQDIIVPTGMSGPVRVIYGVQGGSPAKVVEGHRVFEIPPGRILLTEAEFDYSTWSHTRFFANDGTNLLRISGLFVGSRVAVVDSCTAPFEVFVIEPNKHVPDAVDRDLEDQEKWNLACEGGRLTPMRPPVVACSTQASNDRCAPPRPN